LQLNYFKNYIMKISVDAITLKSGGGKKHLEGMLSSISDNSKFKYIVWVDKDSPFIKYSNKKIEIIIISDFFSSTIGYVIWQLFLFEIKSFLKGSKILFIPSGLSLTYPLFLKKVSVFRNMLFEELDQIFLHEKKNILILLSKKFIHDYTILTSHCYICLNKHARKIIRKKSSRKKFIPVIPHSTETLEDALNGTNLENDYCKNFKNFKLNIFYPSHISPYKNQHLVIKEFDEFMSSIKKENKNLIGLHFAGGKTYPYFFKVQKSIELSKYKKNINIYENLPQRMLFANMKKANVLIFASSCENHPNLIFEMIQYNSNILCHDKEIYKSEFGDYFQYFDINKKGSLSKLLKNKYLEFLENSLKTSQKINFKAITLSENLKKYEEIFYIVGKK